MQALRPGCGWDRIATAREKGCHPSFRAARSKTTPEDFTGRGRHRVRLRTRRIKWAGAGQAGHPDFPFHFRVVGLEVGVRDGPIRKGRAGNGANLAALDEINFVDRQKFAVKCTLVPPTAAAIKDGTLRLGFSLGVLRKVFGWSFGWLVSFLEPGFRLRCA